MKRLVLILATFVFVFVFGGIQAQELPYEIKHYNLKNKLAVQGYDVVAYFSGEAIEGKKELSHTVGEVIYHFSSKENLELFQANPTKYEPEYGGYCAYAMADGDKVKIDPKTFKIIENKLFLFYNFRSTNTLELWNKQEQQLLPKANKAWLDIIKEK